jgi:CDP-diacylglycerol--glycerol-3-phosphate 3-phosphatidyltransferase
MKIPNVLTLVRILFTPVFILFFTHDRSFGDDFWNVGAFAIAILFEVTDVLDGQIARRTGQVSSLGKFLDPLADSMSRFTVFLCFLWRGYASIWVVALIFWRDSIVAMLRIMGATKSVIISARVSGKVKAFVQGTAIITILSFNAWPGTFGLGAENVATLARILMWLTAAVTVASLCDYLYGNRTVIASLDR